MTKAVGYARRSNDKQDGFSIAAQKRAIREYIDRLGHDLVQFYVDDGISGAEWSKRAQFQRMLGDAEDGRFQLLVVHDQARLSRSHLDMERGMNLLVGAGVEVHTPGGAIPWASSQGRTTTRITAVIDQGYREQIADLIRDRKHEMARQGYQQGDPPYGYERGPGRVFVAVPGQAELVASIYTRYLGGESSTTIAKDLNARGVRTRKGHLWTRDSIHGILRNPTYAGLVHFNHRKTRNVIGPGKHAAIVSEARFSAVQELAASRRRGGSPHPFGRDPLPLTGVTFDRWGHRLAGAGRGLMRCYANRMLDGSACPQGTAHAEILEAQIGAYVSTMVIPDAAVAAIVAEAQAMLAPPAGDPAAIRRDQSKLLDAYRADLIDFPTFRQQMTPLKAQLDALERPQREFDLEDALALVRDQGAQWEVMDRAERRTYIHTVLQRVEIEGEQIRAIQPKREWEPLFLIDRDERFSGVRTMVGPAGFEPTTERL